MKISKYRKKHESDRKTFILASYSYYNVEDKIAMGLYL